MKKNGIHVYKTILWSHFTPRVVCQNPYCSQDQLQSTSLLAVKGLWYFAFFHNILKDEDSFLLGKPPVKYLAHQYLAKRRCYFCSNIMFQTSQMGTLASFGCCRFSVRLQQFGKSANKIQIRYGQTEIALILWEDRVSSKKTLAALRTSVMYFWLKTGQFGLPFC